MRNLFDEYIYMVYVRGRYFRNHLILFLKQMEYKFDRWIKRFNNYLYILRYLVYR